MAENKNRKKSRPNPQGFARTISNKIKHIVRDLRHSTNPPTRASVAEAFRDGGNGQRVYAARHRA